jgi:hypothetical protein
MLFKAMMKIQQVIEQALSRARECAHFSVLLLAALVSTAAGVLNVNATVILEKAEIFRCYQLRKICDSYSEGSIRVR